MQHFNNHVNGIVQKRVEFIVPKENSFNCVRRLCCSAFRVSETVKTFLS